MKDIQEEITPVESDDLFVVLDHNDAKFDYPIHCHAEYEINLVLHSDGTHIIGTRQEPFSGMDLIIIAPFVPHVWKAREEGNRVVTVQFSGKMTEFQMMGLRQFRHIESYLERVVPAAKYHLSENDPLVKETLALTGAKGFDATLAFLHLLNSMSEREFTVLGDFDSGIRPYGCGRAGGDVGFGLLPFLQEAHEPLVRHLPQRPAHFQGLPRA